LGQAARQVIWWLVDRAETEQRLEGDHRGGAAVVVAEDVLVEVDGQVFG